MNLPLSTSGAESDVAGRPEMPGPAAGPGEWGDHNPLSGGNRRGGLDGIRCLLLNHPELPHREVRNAEEVRAALADFAATV